MRTLYLHVGWSKTGTSAIQSQIQKLKEEFLEKGILYPQSIQWPDYSHHPFALAFHSNGIAGYRNNMSPKEALKKLESEIYNSKKESVLISSELSPFYFNNILFRDFVTKHFDNVKVIFTVRRQSDFILSLFNQLIKDPNVRCRESLYSLTVNNIANMNYFQQIQHWDKVVGKDNIIVIPYGKDVVNRFLAKFDISLNNDQLKSNQSTVNDSLPTRCLLLMQKQGSSLNINSDYLKTREYIKKIEKDIPIKFNTIILFSKNEQKSLDRFYEAGNINIEKLYLKNEKLFTEKDYKDILALPANYKID